jgi:hypothetical protein
MNINFLKRIAKGKHDPNTVQIVAQRPMHLQTADGSWVDTIAGQSYTVSVDTARSMNHQDMIVPAWNEAARQQREASEVFLPDPVEPMPDPIGWEKLPECFLQWWRLNQRFFCLLRREENGVEMLVGQLKSSGGLMISAAEPHPRNAAAFSALVGAVAEGTANQSQNDMATIGRRRLQEFVNDLAEQRRRLMDAEGENLTRLNLACSDYVIESHGRLRRLTKQAADTALQIFSCRIASLGLSDMKVAALFSGSADCVEYVHSEPGLQDLKLGWHEADGTTRHYIERPVPTLASLALQWDADAKRMESLVAKAKATLAKTQKAAA